MPERPEGGGPRFIMGTGLALRRLEREDLPHVRRWLDDPELRRLIGSTSPMSEQDALEWFQRVQNDSHRAWYVIVLDEGDRIVGEAGLVRMNAEWRTTDMTVIIGEPDVRGNGYGTEAARLILDLAFGYYGFHRVAIGVVGFNEGALRFWKRLGFREEGVQRDGYFHDGQFHDFVMMSILKDEWGERRQAAGGTAQEASAE